MDREKGKKDTSVRVWEQRQARKIWFVNQTEMYGKQGKNNISKRVWEQRQVNQTEIYGKRERMVQV